MRCSRPTNAASISRLQFIKNEWLRRGEVKTATEWLFGENGDRYRRIWQPQLGPSGRLPTEFLDSWTAFFEANRGRTADDLQAEIDRTFVEHGELQRPPLKGRRRRVRLRSDPQFTAAARRALKGGGASSQQ
jgi:hypothetical protein